MTKICHWDKSAMDQIGEKHQNEIDLYYSQHRLNS